MSSRLVPRRTNITIGLFLLLLVQSFAQGFSPTANAEIAATHVYHNHMPNFWPYYDTTSYSSASVGSPIRYMYDGQVIELKQSPPANYPYYLPNGNIMPHDDLVSYYTHNAKTGAYLTWPWSVAQSLQQNFSQGQMQVTMSGALVNNVNDLVTHGGIAAYSNPSWGTPWKSAYDTLRSINGKRTMDLIHFSGHHSMGPLVGNDYLLKDLIYQNVTLAQPYFLGSSFQSSKGFFPTELGFSERIIPVLEKMGIQWSVIGNNHFSRTLKDYPYLNDPGVDTMVSPPNRADLQNTSNVGSWISQPMFNEQQVVRNKFPFASTPHWVKYVNPTTGNESKIVGVPVAQAESWEEGYQGSVTAKDLKSFEGLTSQKQFFVVAHDGDNSSGRAGSEETWRNAGNVTYRDSGVTAMGIDEYLVNNTPAASDVVHVQDGSWIDTRDSSSDPQWHHWKLPFGIWKGQFADFNAANGTNYEPKKNINGEAEGMTVSFEYGYHYLERNFALLQAALNYAQTAEQIWLGDHPSYWQPTTTLDKQVAPAGNQLNPWMMSFPVKGDASNDYKGGANPAELAWYFLIPAMDSGFGYYDENIDDSVKPTLSFNQSLYFSKPYVAQQLAKDATGPSVWWPQRWPYNPGSVNKDKSEGWTAQYFDNNFAIYTYAYDVSGISDIKVKVRTHRDASADSSDNTFRVYNPTQLAAAGVPNIDPAKVSDWVSYDMKRRDLKPDMNGVAWQASSTATMQKLKAQETGDLFYTYLGEYRNQLVDYYIEAVDAKGNVTKSDIQSVYVGAGTYKNDGGKIVEDVNGTIQGTYPFLTDKPIVPDTEAPTVPSNVTSPSQTRTTITLNWSPSTDNKAVKNYEIFRDGVSVGTSTTTSFTDSGLTALTSYGYQIKAVDAAGNSSEKSDAVTFATNNLSNEVTVYYKPGYTAPYIHYRPAGGTWTTAPGEAMAAAEVTGYFKKTVDVGTTSGLEAVFNNGSGTWDNNGGKNYTFGLGVWTFDGGTITSGAPTPPPTPETEPPTVPSGLTAVPSAAGTSVALSWTASTDNVGVTGYEVFRDGAAIGTTTTLAYTDSGRTPGATYAYSVRAYDAAGNKSVLSTSVSVTMPVPATNKVTVYYKPGFSAPYIHYRPAGGTWTTAPGVLMSAAEVSGYFKITVDVGTATGLEADFNNGSGTWDNNNGNNYNFGIGTWTFSGGTITSGVPTPVAQQVTFTVTVPSNTPTTADVYLASDLNNWNAADSAYKLTRGTDGKYTITLPLAAGTVMSYKFTRGAWTSVESASNGSDIANRSYTVPSGSTNVALTVQKWKDI
ncbi:carbohydrate binding protein with CBM25 domain [Paenibacillus cellulosilyticus]|uniref:Carbohydrate binding protein with CBM25 domain n=1 Tax=Paenibacillus cellulosilyticus TaxID=375489 RepID=A0A2V2YXQ7_9BACL|nr:carbohydrate binding protein with CBM25 domain [Paenibacillus cellulosilyticus]QKS45307.1 alpha-amylase [Paenibacillus cellulosilyticus]